MVEVMRSVNVFLIIMFIKAWFIVFVILMLAMINVFIHDEVITGFILSNAHFLTTLFHFLLKLPDYWKY